MRGRERPTPLRPYSPASGAAGSDRRHHGTMRPAARTHRRWPGAGRGTRVLGIQPAIVPEAEISGTVMVSRLAGKLPGGRAMTLDESGHECGRDTFIDPCRAWRRNLAQNAPKEGRCAKLSRELRHPGRPLENPALVH